MDAVVPLAVSYRLATALALNVEVRLLPQVVVTGLGTFTSLGHDAETFFNNLLEGKCGIGPVTLFDPAEAQVKIASEVRDFDVTQYWSKKESRR